MQMAGLALLAALLVTMGLDKDWRVSWMVGVPWLAGLTIVYFLWKRTPAGAATFAAHRPA
jgi:L-asparagine transporter-like permease